MDARPRAGGRRRGGGGHEALGGVGVQETGEGGAQE